MTQREFPSSTERSCFFLCTGLTAEWRRNCCFGSRAGSWGHSPLECCLRYSLNSHTGRWIALPHFFFLLVCQTVLVILHLQTSHDEKRWKDPTCFHALKRENPILMRTIFLFFFSPSTRHLDYPAFHTMLFCSCCRSETTSPIGLCSWKRGWVWFISGD